MHTKNTLLTRRRLMHIGALAGSHCLISSCSAEHKPINSSMHQVSPSTLPLGIQLYTVREQLAVNAANTLQALSGFGYQEVELAGLPDGVSAADFRMMLDDNGLKCPAMHAQGQPASQLEIAHAVGASMVIMPAPMALLNDDWTLKPGLTEASYQAVAMSLNEIGAEYKAHGLSFGYHNHAWEMEFVGEKRGYDILLEKTDPELVFMELDLGWTHQGKVNALELFDKHPGRFVTCHVKDFSAAGDIVNPGDGVVPLQAPLAQKELAGMRHFFVEHDNSSDPLDTANKAVRYVRSLAQA